MMNSAEQFPVEPHKLATILIFLIISALSNWLALAYIHDFIGRFSPTPNSLNGLKFMFKKQIFQWPIAGHCVQPNQWTTLGNACGRFYGKINKKQNDIQFPQKRSH